MAKDDSAINQHKKLAMGKGVTGMKKGGTVKKDDKKSDKKKK